MTLLLLFQSGSGSSGATGTAFQSFVEAGMFLGIWQLDDYLTFTACIHDDTGAAADADAVPSYAIYENETATAIVIGNMAKLGAVDGFYTERVQLTAASGFEIGKCYVIRIAATVGTIPAAAAHVFQMGGAIGSVVDPATIAAAILATPAYKLATLSGGEIVISPETVVSAYLTSASSDGEQLIANAANNLAPASTGATGSIRAKLDAIKLITDAIDTSAVVVTSTNDAGVLTFTKGVTFAATVSGLTISGTWAKLYFTLKESDYDTDDLALVQIVETNPGAGADGLLYLDGAAIASPITVADGTLTVNQVAGTVAIALTDNATSLLAKTSGLVWDIKTKDAAGATVQNATGTASITQSVTQTI